MHCTFVHRLCAGASRCLSAFSGPFYGAPATMPTGNGTSNPFPEGFCDDPFWVSYILRCSSFSCHSLRLHVLVMPTCGRLTDWLIDWLMLAGPISHLVDSRPGLYKLFQKHCASMGSLCLFMADASAQVIFLQWKSLSHHQMDLDILREIGQWSSMSYH